MQLGAIDGATLALDIETCQLELRLNMSRLSRAFEVLNGLRYVSGNTRPSPYAEPNLNSDLM
jgi:hypothetical protein